VWVVSDHDVVWFEISMYDHLLLEIFDGECDLSEVVPGFEFCDSFPPLDELVEGLRGVSGTWLVHSSSTM
jgi:hypothetical protein